MAYDNQGAAVGAAGHYAAAITAALITTGQVEGVDAALDTFNELLSATFESCESLKGTLPEAPAPARSGGRNYGNRGGGRRASGSSGGGNSDPGSVDFRGGKFAGKTIAEVYAMDDDDNDGPGYLEWCVGNLKNDFMVSRITAFLDTVAA